MSELSSNPVFAFDIASSAKLAEKIRPRTFEPVVKPRDGRRSLFGGFLLHLPRAVWMLIDILIVWSGTLLGHELFVWWISTTEALGDFNHWIASIILASSVVLAGSMFGLYDATTLWSRSRMVARCLLTVTVAMAATWLVMHLFMYSQLSRRAAATGMAIYLVNASLIRLLAHHAVRDVRRGLLVIGQGPLTGKIIRSVRRESVPGYRLIGVIGSNAATVVEHGASDIPVVGDISRIESICREHDVAEVVVADGAMQNPGDVRAALTCLRLGCRVTDETTFYEAMYQEVPVSHITPTWFLNADLKGQLREHAVSKRVFDLVVSAVGLALCAPLLPLIALVIKLSGSGPVLYSQRRVGKAGRVFTLYKFRTMRADAESGGSMWAGANDPRVTGVGKWLRKTRLDELPQLWNILRGEMSVVGPRPERPEFVAPLSGLIPYFDQRHLIKPGLTGWAQINHGYGATIGDARQKLQYDLYYIKHTSLELDLIILLRTFGTFCLGAR